MYADAELTCTANDARLCTLEELLAGDAATLAGRERLLLDLSSLCNGGGGVLGGERLVPPAPKGCSRQDGVHEVAGRANFGMTRKQAQLEAQRAADGLIPRVAGFCSGKHLSCFEGEDHCTYNNNFCLILVLYIHFQLFYLFI